MRNLLCVLLAALMLFTASSVFAQENEKVEISFFIGDETLTINGKPVTVEKPYIVGAGVTLVPLRVITEAFGATVEWIGETKSVVLTYPDVSIFLQIDNPIAKINGKAEKLLSAPELTNNGFTMVPLRFISENFGATVSYEHKNQKITVVKGTRPTDGTVEGAVTTANIGDSFFEWSMKNPTNMQMLTREFDGTYTEFAYDESDGLSLSIKIPPEDYDPEQDFQQWKNDLSGMTLLKAEKTVTDNIKSMHFQAKDKTKLMDVRIFMTDKYGYLLLGVCDNSNTERKNELIAIMDSFSLTYREKDIHDLSNVKNGTRTFTWEPMKFSIDIPQEYFRTDTEDRKNRFTFANALEKVSNSFLNVEIYSKSQVDSAEELARKDYEGNQKKLNTSIVTFQKVIPKTYANFSCYEYSMRINATATKRLIRDVFFELGEYVYNITVSFQLPDTTANSKTDAILNSVKAEELDGKDVGLLLRDITFQEGSHTIKKNNWSLTVPNTYEEITTASTGTVLQSKTNGTSISLTVTPDKDASFKDARNVIEAMEKSAKAEGATIVKKTTDQYIAGTKNAVMTYSMADEDNLVYYYTQYAGIRNNCIVVFTIRWPELGYCSNNIKEAEGIFKSFTITK